jgi:hypothetical protein
MPMPTATWACAATGTNAKAAVSNVAKPSERRMRMIYNLPAALRVLPGGAILKSPFAFRVTLNLPLLT